MIENRELDSFTTSRLSSDNEPLGKVVARLHLTLPSANVLRVMIYLNIMRTKSKSPHPKLKTTCKAIRTSQTAMKWHAY